MRETLLILMATAIVCGTADAQTLRGQAPHGVLDADTNKDGEVSSAEFLAMNIARFARMDANHDDRLSIEERSVERAPNGLPPLDPKAPRKPGDVDADGDGFVSRAEFFFNVGRIFSRFDANGDGKIAGDEIGSR